MQEGPQTLCILLLTKDSRVWNVTTRSVLTVQLKREYINKQKRFMSSGLKRETKRLQSCGVGLASPLVHVHNMVRKGDGSIALYTQQASTAMQQPR